ncbi:MAG: hypothetical protein VKI63_09415 [Cyanobium sp.]|nr:hypothetical protein [Cyanobium sp.]
MTLTQHPTAVRTNTAATRSSPGESISAFLAGTILSILGTALGLLIASQWSQPGQLQHLITVAGRIQRALQPNNSAPPPPPLRSFPAVEALAKVSIPLIPQEPAVPDPAAAMQARFHGHTWGGQFVGLDAGMDHYRRLSGTLARMQALSLRNRSAAHRLPTVLINRTNHCFSGLSIGVYSPSCETIKIDFGEHRLVYEHPVEIEVTLAHEWGHHLIQISGETMSPTEEEVVSDCTAGLAFGYYTKYGLISKNEALKAFEMIAIVGNNSAHGHHPNAEVRLRAYAGGLLSIATPDAAEAQGAIAFCSTLERVLDLQKLRDMDLTWNA